MNRMTAVPIATGIALLLAAASPPAHAADPGCKVVIDAWMKQIGTPTHAVMTETTALRNQGKPRTSEMIYLSDANYVQVEGQWTRLPVSAQERRQQEEEKQRNSKMTCRYLRDEAIGGETAAVYHAETHQPDAGTSQQTLWVSKRNGLPLKSINDIDGALHMVILYDYANVKPPAGVK